METLRAGVIGVGYLGNFHAQKYRHCPGVELYGVVDTDYERAREVASKYQVGAYADYRDLFDKVDIVSIVVPPAQHYRIARDFLENGIHTLVEKPVTETVEQAELLIQIANTSSLVLQVGHLERFNPAIRMLRDQVCNPLVIETTRTAIYKERGTEVDVVLDLMIHDIDIVLSLAECNIESIEASGSAIKSDKLDVATASILFQNGLRADLSASRVAKTQERSMRVCELNRYLSLDYINHRLEIGRMENGNEIKDTSALTFGHTPAGTDILKSEIVSFVDSVLTGEAPAVSGEDGKKALEVAINISRHIARK